MFEEQRETYIEFDNRATSTPASDRGLVEGGDSPPSFYARCDPSLAVLRRRKTGAHNPYVLPFGRRLLRKKGGGRK
jgi:hypothetical protein